MRRGCENEGTQKFAAIVFCETPRRRELRFCHARECDYVRRASRSSARMNDEEDARRQHLLVLRTSEAGHVQILKGEQVRSPPLFVLLSSLKLRCRSSEALGLLALARVN